MQRKGNGMSDIVRRLWKGIADTDAQQDAADRIEQLEAALAKADELAEAMELLMVSSEDDSDTLGIADDALAAYRQARDATR